MPIVPILPIMPNEPIMPILPIIITKPIPFTHPAFNIFFTMPCGFFGKMSYLCFPILK